MDEMAARKVSVSMRNAITANNYHGHALGKTVKQLEVEKDLKMMSLQIKTDEMRLSSSPKMTRKKGDVQPTNEGEELVNISNETIKERKGTLASTQRPQFLPLIRSYSAKTRRSGFSQQHSSSLSSPSSPRPARSTGSVSSSFDDVNREKIIDQRVSVVSTTLSRSATASPILTAKLPKTLSSGQGNSPPSSLVHRGLVIRPLSLNNSATKQTPKTKQSEKAKAVFSRLYKVQPAKPKKSIVELMEGAQPASPRLDRRRRSISMPDLSEAMDDLRNCRYLRQNSNDDTI